MENVTSVRKIRMIGWIAVGITALLFAAMFWQIDDWGRDWTQNSASLDPNADRPELRPLQLPTDVDETLQRIREFCQRNQEWGIVSVDERGETPLHVHLTRTTLLFRFVDDVEVTITELPGDQGVTVQAESRSRVGKGDLGQNPRNLAQLTRGLARDGVQDDS